jgi:hypothetical protein
MHSRPYCVNATTKKLSKVNAKEKFLTSQNLVTYRASSKQPMRTSVANKVSVAVIEFAGVKFKTKAITGKDYLQGVQDDYIEKTMSAMPNVERIVLVEEKYSYTPDNFKAATREQRKKSSSLAAIHHLKTGHEMLSSEKFNKDACINSTEGKSLIGTYAAKNIENFHIQEKIIIDIDSELHIWGCQCKEEISKCNCQTYAVPV